MKLITHPTEAYQSLTNLNTMALNCSAKDVILVSTLQALTALPKSGYFILSGGSNVVLPERLEATVVMPRIMGIQVLEESQDTVVIEVGAGENWHNLVVSCTTKGWYGLENLALIPGLVGAAPVQNIGAYGVSLQDVLVGVKAYRLSTAKHYYIKNEQCQFGYRSSIFKQAKELLITSVVLRLHKNSQKVCADYADLQNLLINKPATPLAVMQAVGSLRRQKLPNPDELPNCGSFFQNPLITRTSFEPLKQRYQALHYDLDNDTVKIPAAWLIDRAGLKGGGIAPILTHKNQALVLTNHAKGLATQKHIKKSQDFIIKTVKDMFGIVLVREPVWVFEDGSYECLTQSVQEARLP